MKPAAADDNGRQQAGERPRDPEDDAAEATVLSLQQEPEQWASPIPFGPGDLPAFPVEVLPPALRDYATAVGEAVQVPVDMPAVLALAAVAACVQRRLIVEVRDGYVEPLSLFVAVVSEPGTRKTAAFSAITSPIEKWERDEALRLGPEIERARAERAVAEKRKARLEDEAAKAKERDEVTEKMESVARIATDLAAAQTGLDYPRVLADDVTPEQLARLMVEQGERLAVFSAEGGIFETMAGRYSNGVANLDIFLKGHAGDWLRVDRRGGSPVIMSSPALTIGLAVQSEVLRSLVDKPGFRGRGLLARFLYVLAPNLLGRRRINTSPVPVDMRSAYESCIRGLLDVKAQSDGNPSRLRLSGSAVAEWRCLAARIEPRLGSGGDLGHVADWAGKATGAAVRIAGLLHAVRCVGDGRAVAGEICKDDMAAGARLVEGYFIPHATAGFIEMGVDSNAVGARMLVDWLAYQGLEVVSVMDVFNKLRGRARFHQVEPLARAFELAEQHRYVRRLPDAPRSGPGRPASARYLVSPGLRGHPLNPRNPRNAAALDDSTDFTNIAEVRS